MSSSLLIFPPIFCSFPSIAVPLSMALWLLLPSFSHLPRLTLSSIVSLLSFPSYFSYLRQPIFYLLSSLFRLSSILAASSRSPILHISSINLLLPFSPFSPLFSLYSLSLSYLTFSRLLSLFPSLIFPSSLTFGLRVLFLPLLPFCFRFRRSTFLSPSPS